MPWYNYVNVGLLCVIWVIIFKDLNKYKAARSTWLIFLGIYTLTEFISMPLEMKGINNLWLYNSSKPIQFILLALYFTKTLNFEKTKKRIFLIFSLLLCTLSFFFTDFSNYNSLPDIVFNSVIIILCINYFYLLIKYDDFIYLSESEFWYCAGLFIYYVTSLCINGTLNFLIQTNLDVARKLFYFLVINSFIFYFLIIYALLAGKKK